MTKARIIADYVAGGTTAAEFDVLDGLTSTTAELNYVDGVTSNVQTQLDAKLALAGGTITGVTTIKPSATGDVTVLNIDGDSSGNVGNIEFKRNNVTIGKIDSSYSDFNITPNGTSHSADIKFNYNSSYNDTAIKIKNSNGYVGIGQQGTFDDASTEPSLPLHVTCLAYFADDVGIGVSAPNSKLKVVHTTSEWVGIFDKNRTDSATNLLARSGVNGGSTALFKCEGNHPDLGGSSTDGAFLVENDGALKADSATISTPADYAEYFESTDDSAIPAGTTVLLENGKVRASKDSETPMGVIRPPGASTTVGNASPMNYYSKYKRDVFGAHIYEEYTVTAWTDEDGKYHNYPSDEIPNDLTAPDDAEIITHEILPEGYEVSSQKKLTRRITNPDYDSSKTYIPREDRDEWNIVGLLGQVTILKGQPTAPSWIKMWDIDSSYEMWFIK